MQADSVVARPNELIPISPETLEVIETYLSSGNNIGKTAESLGIHPAQVTQYLNLPEVKSYLDHLYLAAGYRNRNKIAEVLDNVIEKKLEEMGESGLGSNKDIADLLQLAHKMRMDELSRIAEIEKIKAGTVKKQTNIQINESPFNNSNYSALLDKLIGG